MSKPKVQATLATINKLRIGSELFLFQFTNFTDEECTRAKLLAATEDFIVVQGFYDNDRGADPKYLHRGEPMLLQKQTIPSHSRIKEDDHYFARRWERHTENTVERLELVAMPVTSDSKRLMQVLDLVRQSASDMRFGLGIENGAMDTGLTLAELRQLARLAKKAWKRKCRNLFNGTEAREMVRALERQIPRPQRPDRRGSDWNIYCGEL